MASMLVWFISILVSLIASSKSSSVIVEKGYPTRLQCTFSSNVSSITWQLWGEITPVNLSICTVVNSSCTDLIPLDYHGVILRSGNESVFGLNVTSARFNETDFSCLADNGTSLHVTIEVYDPPIVGKLLDTCPFGKEMFNFVFPIGATAECQCYLEYEGVPASFPRWFARNGTKVGEEVSEGGINSSSLAITYDYTDPNQSYECRAINSLNISATPYLFTPRFTNDIRIIEMEKSLNLECSFSKNVTSVTWQLLQGDRAWDISTCSVVDGNCTDLMPTFYNATISSSGGITTVGLNATSVRLNETLFSCLVDNEMNSNITQLAVFARPSKPQCRLSIDSTIDITCTTGNVYPQLKAILHRREVDFSKGEYGNTVWYNSSDPRYTHSANLNFWVGTMYKPHQITVYVEVIPDIPGHSLINSAAVVSDDISINLRMPEVALNTTFCPYGPGVNGSSILIGTTASCLCELLFVGSPPGYTHWYGNSPMTYEDHDRSSTITFSYDPLNPNQSYECSSISLLIGNPSSVIYKPIFVAEPLKSIAVTGSHFAVTFLGVSIYGIASLVGFN